MKLNFWPIQTLLSMALLAIGLSGGSLRMPSAHAASPASELCLKIARMRDVAPPDWRRCQEKIANATFDSQAVGVCSAMIDLRLSTAAQVNSCLDAIRDKAYPDGTDRCLMMFNSLATTHAITSCLSNSGRLIPAYSSNAPGGASASSEIEEIGSIERAISRIDAALFQLDSDGASAGTVYAMQQLLIAKNELLKLKVLLSARLK